jgi:5-formyltetrahydrofolate cyclo-ligase
MDMLRITSLEDYGSLEPDSWGIPSIPEASVPSRRNCLSTEEEEEPGLDLMPGVAFDKAFGRLGHGKGFYDTFLTRCREALGEGRMPVLVALALKEQLLEGEDVVPMAESDWRVDVIVRGDGRVLRRAEL